VMRRGRRSRSIDLRLYTSGRSLTSMPEGRVGVPSQGYVSVDRTASNSGKRTTDRVEETHPATEDEIADNGIERRRRRTAVRPVVRRREIKARHPQSAVRPT